MQVTVTKKDGESNERLISRFTKKVQGSRKLLKIRTERYHSGSTTKRKVREGAIMREKYRKQREKTRFYQ